MATRCLRCGRELTATHAAYGPKCAQILDIDQRGLTLARVEQARGGTAQYMQMRYVLDDGEGGYYGGDDDGYDDGYDEGYVEGYEPEYSRRLYEVMDEYDEVNGFTSDPNTFDSGNYSFVSYVGCMDCDEGYKYLLIDLYNSIDDTSYGSMSEQSENRR